MSIIDMSVVAIPLIASIAAIRFFAVYKLPKKTFYVMWGIVLYQLLIPFNLFARSDISAHIATLSGKLKEILTKTPEITDITSTLENPITTVDTIPTIFNNIFDTVDKFGKDIFDRIEMINIADTDIMTGTAESTAIKLSLNVSPLLLIWLSGLLCFAAYFIVTHIRFRKIYSEALPVDSAFVISWKVEYSDSMRRKVKIKQSDLINSPLTYGIFRPVILLPKTTDYRDEATLKYILLHEYTHIWRFDVLAKLLLVTAMCVHWFNPFVWLMYILANSDIELSCDETVVKKSEINQSGNVKSDYALTLIALEEKKSLLALSVNFSRNLMKERIKAVMKIRKKSKLRIISAIILVSMITVMFAALQSCENIDSGNGTIISTDEDGMEVIQLDENFVMPEQTDKLIVYTFHMNTFTLKPAINIFKEKYPDVEVEIIDLGDDYDTILTTELAAGKGPDLVFAHKSDFPDIYKTMATEIFVDLNEFISRDDEFNLDDYVKPVLDGGVYRGKRYIMPVEYGIPLLTTTQEILDEEGFVPTDFNTFDGFIKTLEQYNEKYKDNPEKSALIDWKHNRINLEYFLQTSGINLIDYEKSKVGTDKTNFKKFIDLMKQLYISDEDRKNIDISPLISGIVGMTQGRGLGEQHWLFNNYFTTTGTMFSVELGYLASNNLKSLMFTYPNINNGVTADIIQFAAIPKSSANQINAYNLLKIILSEEIQAGGTESGNYLRLGMPVLKSGVHAKIVRDSWGQLDEETINEYTNLMLNIDSAKIIPNEMYKFLVDEMTPYWEGKQSFDECYARLVSKLELYVSE